MGSEQNSDNETFFESEDTLNSTIVSQLPETPTGTQPRGRKTNAHRLEQEGRSHSTPITNFFNSKTKRSLSDTEADLTPSKKPHLQPAPPTSVTRMDTTVMRDQVPEADVTLEYILKEMHAMRVESNARMDQLNSSIASISQDCSSQATSLVALKKQLDDQNETWTSNWNKVKSKIENLQKNAASFDIAQADLESRVSALETRTPAECDQNTLSSLQNELSRLRAESEKNMKNQRKNNIILRGVATNLSNSEESEKDVRQFFQDNFSLSAEVSSVQLLHRESGRFRICFTDLATKISVMKVKTMKLKGTGVYIDNDYTPQESEVQFQLRKIARAEKAVGKKVRVANQRILIDNKWFSWDSSKSSLVAATSKQRLNANRLDPKNA